MIPAIDRISARYRSLQIQLHASPRGYGQRGDKWAETVVAVLRTYACGSVLDYGCGQGSLARDLRDRQQRQELQGLRIAEYDPAIAGKDGEPTFADLVTCTDVLEHVEPERLQYVLLHLRQLARKAVFAVISTRTAEKVLADGRNAHLIVESGKWWEKQLRGVGFTIEAPPEIARKKPAREWVGVLRP